jgi:hypothetical protein
MALTRGLQCYQGGRHLFVRLGPVDLVMAPVEDPPFAVEVEVVEEDTWRLLSSPPVLRPASEHPIRLMTRVVEDRPGRHGDLLCQGGRWRAVVYDLDQEPVCRESWVRESLCRLWSRAMARGCHNLAMPLLGATHRGISWTRSLELIAETVLPLPPGSGLRRVWLQVEDGRLLAVRQRLERWGESVTQSQGPRHHA